MSEPKIFRIRASSDPHGHDLPGLVRTSDGETLVDPVSDAGDGGSAAHDVMAALVDADATSLYDIDLEAIARRWSVEVEQLRILGFIGLKVWKVARDWLRPAQSEVYLEASFEVAKDVILEMTGHVDALAIGQRAAAHGDWKFGMVDRNYHDQVDAYSALVLGNYPKVESVDGFVGWIRSDEVERVPTMTRDRLWEWLDRIRERVVEWNGVFHPGPQCTFCVRATSCPALAQQARRDALVFGGPDMAARIESGLADLADHEVVAIFRRWKALEKLGDDLTDAVKRRVRAAGGRLPDGDGRELRFVSSESRVSTPISRCQCSANP